MAGRTTMLAGGALLAAILLIVGTLQPQGGGQGDQAGLRVALDRLLGDKSLLFNALLREAARVA